jgi:hypothetical protein
MMLRPTIRSDPTICDDLRSSARSRRRTSTTINATIRAGNTGGLGFCRRIRFVDDSIRRAVPLKNGVPSIGSTDAMFCD